MKFIWLVWVHPWVNEIVFGNNWPNRITDMVENVPPNRFFGFSSAGMGFLKEKTLKRCTVTPFPTKKVILTFVIRRLISLSNGGQRRSGTVELPSIFARFDPPPHDYFTFPKLKLKLKGDHYASIEDIQKSVTTKLKVFPISDFARAMKRLEDRTNECIQVSGDYFE